MVALDAMEWTRFERFLGEGRLPNLARFAARLAPIEVRSDGETLHGSVWPTFASGTRPGAHGVYFWTQWLAEEMRHVRNNHPAFAYDPFWAALAPAGMRATVVDVPYIPAVEAPGFRTLMGWGLHDEVVPVSSPPGFRAWVERSHGKHPLSFDTVEPQSSRDKLKMTRDMRRGVHMRARLLADLAARRDWDLLITTFSELHKAGHYLAAPQRLSERLSNEDAVAAILQPLDAAWPRIMDAAGDDCHVFLFAVHGTVEQADFSAFARQLLDLLAGRPPVDAAAHPDLLRRIRDLVPDAVHRAIWKRLPARVRASRQGALSLGGVDVSHENIFSVVHDGHAAVRVNLAGRERDGFVGIEDREELLRRLEELAKGFHADDGQPAFTGLLRSDEQWPGARAHRLPDGLVLANLAVKGTRSLRRDDGLVLTSSRPEARNGIHTSRGFCFFRPGSEAKATRESIDNVDFAPTVLQLLGITQPGHLSGESFVQ
jgi:predicted AlkP superfamily phosphohydrolase/phosphomutase